MHRRSSAALLLGSLLLSGLLSASEISIDPADDLIARLNMVTTLHAHFEQTGQSERLTGEFWLSKPDKFRVESHPPLSQTIVSDGSSLWTFDADLEQVIISDLSNSAENIPILFFASNPARLKDSYRVDAFTDEELHHFVLLPTTPNANISRVAIAFDGPLPVRLSFQNAMQERTVIDFVDRTTENGIEDVFIFTAPDGVDVIDDRQNAAAGD
ncbi:MAG: outer membrane lipoprotein chaperone LolA [Gammaproteobacteria bacterium]